MCTRPAPLPVMPAAFRGPAAPGMAILLADTLARAAGALVGALDQAGLFGCSVAWEGPDGGLQCHPGP
ncbi:MAG: hypothetical protein NDI68_01975, partial [Arenimonas sp.]|nr:hypothetical protein [Arenimonas sp.]